ncbi:MULTISPECIES: CHAD domain-containing protein [Pseudomonas]|uniref:CHAD domain-containing protein n=1 Tax=Pseudomonas TaxID=286 RepID=UPI003002D99D
MSALTKDLREQVIRLHVAIIACVERVRARTDAEALHDLRINLRKLRSLLKPVGDRASCMELQRSAAALGTLTGPLRDLEVLEAELWRLGDQQAARARAERVVQGYAGVACSQQTLELLQALEAWPADWLASELQGELKQLRAHLHKRLRKDQQRLRTLLHSEALDWHELRLLVKRVRYGAQAYPQLCGLSTRQQATLKRAQSSLGTWHDHLQWLHRAETEPDLQACTGVWSANLQGCELACTDVVVRLQAQIA